MQTLYPTYNDNATLYHHTALAHLAGIMRELFCPKPPIPPQIDQEEPEHLVIDMPTVEPQEEEYLLIHQPETILQQHTIPHITLNQYRPTTLQIICNCLAKYFRKPKQKY